MGVGSDRIYRAIVEQMGEGALVLARDGRILYANRRFAEIVGLPLDKVVGAELESFHSDSDVPILRNYLPGAHPRVNRRESVLVRPNGEKVRVSISLDHLVDCSPSSYCLVVTDLTERKRAEAELMASEARFRSVVEHVPVGLFIVQDGIVVFMNPEQERLFGSYPASLEKCSGAAVHPEDQEMFLKLCSDGRPADCKTGATELRYFPKGAPNREDTPRYAHCRATDIRYRGDRAVLVNMIDVTRTKEIEQIVLKQEKLAALGLVAASMAHEIRNPLSGLNIYLYAVEAHLEGADGIDPATLEKTRALLDTARGAAEKIEDVIRRVMDYARPASLKLVEGQINLAVSEAVVLGMMVLGKSGIKLETRLADGLPLCLADLRLVEQAILNLIVNAGQAVEQSEGRGGRIEISTALEGRHILIRVGDSGPGVPPHLRERIFEPFFTTRSGGTGIGLAFTSKIIANHDGFLEVGESFLGGAEFRVYLPLGR